MDDVIVFPNETEVVARALTEPKAFTGLFDHYAPRIYTFMRYRVDDAQAADDLTAQTFEHALAHLKNYQAEQAPFGAWLFGIAHHMVSRHYRTQKRHHWLPLDSMLSYASDVAAPEEITIDTQTRDQLLQALRKLSDRQREIIALKFAGELNNRQIAALVGLSESNVGVILYRSIKQLRTLLYSEGKIDE